MERKLCAFISQALTIPQKLQQPTTMKLISTFIIAALVSATHAAPSLEHARNEIRREATGLPIDVCSIIPNVTLPIQLGSVLQVADCSAGQVCSTISGTLSTLLGRLPNGGELSGLLGSLGSIELPAGLGVSEKR